MIHVHDPEGEGLRLRRGQPGEVARPRGVRSRHRRGAEEGERPADLDPGVRRRPHGARPASTPSWWRSPRRCRRGTGTNIFQKKYPERFFDVGIAEGHAVTFAGGLATQGIRPVVRDLQHVPPARLRQRHPRHRGAAPAGDLLHGPRGPGGRGRPDPHGAVRHRLHAGGAGHDGDRAQGRRRADRPAPHRRWRTPTARSAPAIPRDKAPAEPRPASRDPGGAVRHLGAAPARARTSPSSRSARWCRPRSQAAELLAADGHRLRGGELPLPQAARLRDARVAGCSGTACW